MGKLGIYLLINYPSREAFLEAVRICEKENIDFLEIGLPFSDPVADGDALEKACYETLHRYSFDEALISFREARKIFGRKIYIMTYANIVYGPGIDNFAGMFSDISGIILADTPMREARLFEGPLAKRGINIIRFLTPESRDGDIDKAVRDTRDFIYFVSRRGITGGNFDLDAETRAKIGRAREKGGEVFLGFGIQDRNDLELALQYADGAIIGTRAVRELAKGTSCFRHYIEHLRR